jgi:hypothetical protein
MNVLGAAPPEDGSRHNPPMWMDVTGSQPPARTGVVAKGSGLQTILFFALITIVVGAAGLFGVTMWGPDKTITNRSQFATNPPPPTQMPSLPVSAEPAPPAVEAAPAPSDSAGVAAALPTKKAKRAPVPRKHH